MTTTRKQLPVRLGADGYPVEMKEGIVRAIIHLVRWVGLGYPCNAVNEPSPYETEEGVKVATVQRLLQSGRFEFPYSDGFLRRHYLPWLHEQGVLVAHTDIKRYKGGRAKIGYTLNADLDLNRFWLENYGKPYPDGEDEQDFSMAEYLAEGGPIEDREAYEAHWGIDLLLEKGLPIVDPFVPPHVEEAYRVAYGGPWIS